VERKDWISLLLLLHVGAILLWFMFTDPWSIHQSVYLVYLTAAIIFFFYARANKTPLLIIIGVYGITLIAGMATMYGWWSEFPNFDGWVHFFILFLVGFMAMELWSKKVDQPLFVFFASIATIVLFGYVIEFAEYVLWVVFDLNMAPLDAFYSDTMDDFLWDLAGGIVGIGAWWLTRRP
jgi:hypothetical protein